MSHYHRLSIAHGVAAGRSPRLHAKRRETEGKWSCSSRILGLNLGFTE